MAIKAKVIVRSNSITKEKLASAAIVDLQPMSFTEFCDYMAQDSTVGAAVSTERGNSRKAWIEGGGSG